MKKHTKKFIAVMMILAIALSFSACKKDGGADAGSDTPKQENTGKVEWKEENGKKTFVDLENSPFEGAGIHTIVDAEAGTVTFFKTDDKGNDTVEYYTFTPAENSVVKYYYVSMMGTGFYCYYDTTAGEMVKIENDKHEDTTQKAKDSGRFDGTAKDFKDEVAQLEKYFMDRFEINVVDAAAGK